MAQPLQAGVGRAATAPVWPLTQPPLCRRSTAEATTLRMEFGAVGRAAGKPALAAAAAKAQMAVAGLHLTDG